MMPSAMQWQWVGRRCTDRSVFAQVLPEWNAPPPARSAQSSLRRPPPDRLTQTGQSGRRSRQIDRRPDRLPGSVSSGSWCSSSPGRNSQPPASPQPTGPTFPLLVIEAASRRPVPIAALLSLPPKRRSGGRPGKIGRSAGWLPRILMPFAPSVTRWHAAAGKIAYAREAKFSSSRAGRSQLRQARFPSPQVGEVSAAGWCRRTCKVPGRLDAEAQKLSPSQRLQSGRKPVKSADLEPPINVSRDQGAKRYRCAHKLPNG